MKTHQIRTATTAIIAVAMVFGCATLKGTSPTEEVLAALADFQATIKAQDLEKIINTYSDDFAAPSGMDKSAVRSLFEGMAAQGMLVAFELINLDKSSITIEEDKAIVTPLTFNTASGEMSFRCEMKKESDGIWRIVKSEQI